MQKIVRHLLERSSVVKYLQALWACYQPAHRHRFLRFSTQAYLDANLPLEDGSMRGDAHTVAAADAGLGADNTTGLAVGTSGGWPLHWVRNCDTNGLQLMS